MVSYSQYGNEIVVNHSLYQKAHAIEHQKSDLKTPHQMKLGLEPPKIRNFLQKFAGKNTSLSVTQGSDNCDQRNLYRQAIRSGLKKSSLPCFKKIFTLA